MEETETGDISELMETPPVEAYREAYANLNDRQARFCQEYLIDLDPRKAAIRCGYSQRSAGATGRALLRNPRVVCVVQYLQARIAARTEVTIENVVREIALVGFARMDDFLSEDEHGSLRINLERAAAGPHGLAAVSSIEQDTYLEREGEDEEGKPIFEPIKRVKFKLWDKTKGLDQLMRHLGGYNDSLEVNLGGGPIAAAAKMKDVSPEQAMETYMDMVRGQLETETERRVEGAKLVGAGGKDDGGGTDSG